MGMKIITGYTGTRHVTAADDAGLHRGAIGTGDYIFDVGNAFAVSVVTNNLVKILDGELISKGQHARIATDDYEECIIENGTQTMKRNDLIVCRFITNQETGIQSAQVVVIKGTEGTTATDPVIMNTQYIHDVKLWRIPLNGLTVGTPVCLFKTVPSLNAINESLTTKLNGCVLKHDAISLTSTEMVTTFKECCAQLKSRDKGLYMFEFTITGIDRVQMLVTWSGETSTSHGLIQSFSRIFFLNESECRFIDINVFNK